MIPQGLRIIRTNSAHPAFQQFVVRLDLELAERYGKVQQVYDEFNKVADINTVVVAFYDGEPVGCGCFKPFDEKGVELKRVYVTPSMRGKRIAVEMIHALERWSRELSFHFVMLETGNKQPEAIQLYTRLGYRQVPNFGPYVRMASSICFRKSIVP